MLLKASHEGFGKAFPTDVFIIGSGFSKAVAPQMPTLPELSRAVLSRVPHVGRTPLPSPAQDNLELMLEFLLTKQPWISDSEYHRRVADALDLTSAIAPVLQYAELETARHVGHRAPEWLMRLAYWMHDQQATIISFNYDTLLEKTFSEITITEAGSPTTPHTLSPRALYPVRFPIEPPEQVFGTVWPTAELLKLHGSINWSYSGARQFFGESIQYTLPAPWSADHLNALPDDKVPLIAPPIADKSAHFSHESVHHLWQLARRSLQNAERLYCVGFGFPNTDLPIRFLLADSHRVTPADFYLVDIDERVIERVRAFLPAHFRLRQDFFGPGWTSELLDHLWSRQPIECAYDPDPATTDKVRSWSVKRLKEGEDLQCIAEPPGAFCVAETSDCGVTILDCRNHVPWHLTWRALGKIVAHLQTSNGGLLPIGRPSKQYHAMSVEYLMSPWYSRACGRVVTSVLTKAGIVFLRDEGTIGGLTPAFVAAQMS